MSIQIIQQRLNMYSCKTDIEEIQAMREITQEVVLAALTRGGFFEHAAFQGGTCLRIFYGLNRFSEDLDFVLKKPILNFQLLDYLTHVHDELKTFGYDIEIKDRNKAEVAVKQPFLKDKSIGKILTLKYAGKSSILKQIYIKLEVDSNPPSGSSYETKYLDFPFASAVTVQDLSSLFAGKIHALLCRKYLKGRDWYDFIWYTSHQTGVNFELLSSAIIQYGPWENTHIEINREWLLQEMEQKIISIDWKKAKEDVRRFIPAIEQPSLEVWHKEFFLSQLAKLKAVLL